MTKFIYFGNRRIIGLGVRRAIALGFVLEPRTCWLDIGPFWVSLEW